MSYEWLKLTGIAAGVVAWLFAVLLWRWSKDRPAARLLAVLLVVEGVAVLSSDAGLFILLEDRARWAGIIGRLHFLADAAIAALYPLFLARALATRLLDPFRTRWGAGLWVGISAGLGALALLDMGSWYLLGGLVVLVFGLALVSSLSNLRVVSTPLARQQAAIFAVAFGLRDLVWGLVYLIAVLQSAGVEVYTAGWSLRLYGISILLYVPLVAYGVVRTHLFDIDLRVKLALSRGTVAAVFVAVFFVVSEGASTVLSAWLGSALGLTAAGLLVFAIVPLYQAAERFADAAMPNVQPTSEYETFRKLQVYQAALEETLQHGVMSDRERAVLDRLQSALGVSEESVRRLELDLLSPSGQGEPLRRRAGAG